MGDSGLIFQLIRILGVAELRYDTRKNTRGNPKMIFEILMGDWNISKFEIMN
jgi:hypothetical protein